MLRIGIVGFGFMGRMHYKCWQAMDDAEVVAVCDSNPNLIADANKAVGNIEGAADHIDFDKMEVFSNFDAMLESGKVDAISLALPTNLHPDFSIKALQAGIHVLCEKPMALDVAECERMIDASRKTGNVLQIGHCVRFWPEYAKAKEIVDSGCYGKIRSAMLQRLSAPPTWATDGWLGDDKRSGGMVLDLHIHDTDYVQYLLGTPKAVQSFIARDKAGSAIHVATHYRYHNDKVVTAEGGWAMTPSFGFEMSFNLLLEGATLTYDCTRNPAFRVCPSDGEAYTPEVAPGDGYSRQIEYFNRSIQGDNTEEVITLDQSMESIRIIQAEIESASKDKMISL
ncbi:MAG: Gfo/Idh/MocA family oxidoreductase [Sedimentisphaerales bacterium]|nr:Gfo/Idh/MocA family oxidoreductase [Sedimentisphaerales bacterium]